MLQDCPGKFDSCLSGQQIPQFTQLRVPLEFPQKLATALNTHLSIIVHGFRTTKSNAAFLLSHAFSIPCQTIFPWFENFTNISKGQLRKTSENVKYIKMANNIVRYIQQKALETFSIFIMSKTTINCVHVSLKRKNNTQHIEQQLTYRTTQQLPSYLVQTPSDYLNLIPDTSHSCLLRARNFFFPKSTEFEVSKCFKLISFTVSHQWWRSSQPTLPNLHLHYFISSFICMTT